jgi:NAD(P)H-nitrite reductase large subunit
VAKADLRRCRLHSTSGEVIGFEQLLIATGSTVRRLHVPGADGPRIFYLRTEGFTAHPRSDQARTASRGDWIRLYWNGSGLGSGKPWSANDHGVS